MFLLLYIYDVMDSIGDEHIPPTLTLHYHSDLDKTGNLSSPGTNAFEKNYDYGWPGKTQRWTAK